MWCFQKECDGDGEDVGKETIEPEIYEQFIQSKKRHGYMQSYAGNITSAYLKLDVYR